MQRKGSIKDFFKPFTQPKSSGQSPDQYEYNDATDFLRRPKLPTPGNSRDRERVEGGSGAGARNSSPPRLPATTGVDQGQGVHEPASAMTSGVEKHHTAPAAPTITSLSSTAPREDSPPAAMAAVTSAAPLSQTSTGSKRTIKDGVAIVKCSDSEEDDSDASLPHPDDLWAPFKKKMEYEIADPRARNLRSRPAPTTRAVAFAEPTALLSLVAKRQREAAAAARVEAAKARLAEMERESESGDDDEEPVTRAMLAAVAADPERLMMALERTEALEKRTVWHLFEERRQRQPRPHRRPFPKDCLPPRGWQSLLASHSRRDAAFLSGMVKSAVGREALPDGVLLWMLDELSLTPRDDLASAYVDVLESCAEQMGSLLDRARIRSLFARLDAKKELLDVAAEPGPEYKMRKDGSRRRPPRLRWLLDLLGRLAPSLASGVRDFVLAILIRLSPDDSIQDKAGLRLLIRSAIGALINSTPEGEAELALSQTSSQLYSWARDPILQFRLFNCLPAYTPRQCIFRRRLALAFFLGSNKALSLGFASPDVLPAVLHRLERSADFVFTARTDYARVSALFNLLDTAVDAGFSDRSFVLVAQQGQKRPFAWTTDADSAREQREEADRKAAARRAEEGFNEGVDALVGAVRRVMSQIRGSGIESLPKSEAKAVMERLAYRLEAAVRTRERSGRSVFDGGVGEGDRELLSRWLGMGGVKEAAG